MAADRDVGTNQAACQRQSIACTRTATHNSPILRMNLMGRDIAYATIQMEMCQIYILPIYRLAMHVTALLFLYFRKREPWGPSHTQIVRKVGSVE